MESTFGNCASQVRTLQQGQTKVDTNQFTYIPQYISAKLSVCKLWYDKILKKLRSLGNLALPLT